MPEVRIGNDDDNFVQISVQSWERPESTEYWDANWVNSRVEVSTAGFTGRLDCTLRAEDFLEFRDQLQAMDRSLAGVATFATMEEWLTLKVVAEANGQVNVEGRLRDPEQGPSLSFRLRIDPSYFPSILSGLNEIVGTFPVRGQRPVPQ